MLLSRLTLSHVSHTQGGMVVVCLHVFEGYVWVEGVLCVGGCVIHMR